MYFTFQREHKSIKQLPVAELPDFTIITGANGAGKTHFLQAITNGALTVDAVPQERIGYYPWSRLATSDEAAADPLQWQQIRKQNCDSFATYLRQYTSHILEQVSPGASRLLQQDRGSLLSPISEQLEKIAQSQLLYIENISQHTEINLRSSLENVVRSKSNFYIENRQVDWGVAFLLLQILKSSNKSFWRLTDQDLYEFYPTFNREIDPFTGGLTDLFAAYVRLTEQNDLAEVRAKRGVPATHLNDKDFVARYGPPPWEVMNHVLETARLSFRFKSPSPDASLPVSIRLHHERADVDIPFSSLSSGEQVLISLAHFLFFSQDVRQPTAMPEVILLDEVDAPLHPAMTVALLETIKEVMVKQYKRKVILATHSPSTVALAPEEAIHVLDIDTKRLRKASRDEGVRALTVGVPILSINLANRRQIFVESQHDVALYERIAAVARPQLEPNVSLTFMAAGHEKNGGCGLLISLVKQLNGAGNEAVFGIVDWDGNRGTDGNVRVLGEDARHSIESYLFDPVLLGALLLREKAATLQAPTLLQGRENYFDLRHFANTRLQPVADAVATALGFPLTDMVPVHYVNGRIVYVPRAYLHLRGHDLEDRIKKTFPELKRFHQEPKLKEEILHKILEDIPELLPADFVTLLISIQGAAVS